jgi:hypothetical protein
VLCCVVLCWGVRETFTVIFVCIVCMYVSTCVCIVCIGCIFASLPVSCLEIVDLPILTYTHTHIHTYTHTHIHTCTHTHIHTHIHTYTHTHTPVSCLEIVDLPIPMEPVRPTCRVLLFVPLPFKPLPFMLPFKPFMLMMVFIFMSEGPLRVLTAPKEVTKSRVKRRGQETRRLTAAVAVARAGCIGDGMASRSALGINRERYRSSTAAVQYV